MNKPLFDDEASWDASQSFYGNLLGEQNIAEDAPNFREALILGISTALINRPETLWQLLYRMDISEKEVGKILESRKDVAEQIADLLIARVQKIRALRANF